MSTRSRARPWFALAQRLERYAVRVDQLEEAGGLWSEGRLLAARDFDRERAAQDHHRERVELIEAMTEMARRDRRPALWPLVFLVSPAHRRHLLELVREYNNLSSLQIEPRAGELRFMGIPVRTDALVRIPALVEACRHPFFNYVVQPPARLTSSWRRFNEPVTAEKTNFSATQVTRCTVCGETGVQPGTYDPNSLRGSVHRRELELQRR